MIRFNTPNGRLKYSSQKEAEKVAEKLGLGRNSHSHMRNGMRIYMPGNNHKNLNDALRERGREPTMVPGQGGGGGGMMSGGMGMMGGGGMMNRSNDGGMLLPDGDKLEEMNKSDDRATESMPSMMGDGSAEADGEFFSDGSLTANDSATGKDPDPDLIRDEVVREPFDSMFGSGDPDDDNEMELY
jgi:hypothetical protein